MREHAQEAESHLMSQYALYYVTLILLYTMSRTGVNLKSRNILILCCDNIPLAKINAPHVLHRSIIRPVLVGFNVAIDLQNRQCTVRSHEFRTFNLLYDIISSD